MSFRTATSCTSDSMYKNKVVKQPSQVSRGYNSLIISTSLWNFKHSQGFTKFHTQQDVKLGESCWRPQVSRGDIMNQALTHRWNLWRLFSNPFVILRQFRGSKITKTFCHFSGKPSTTRQSVSEESREHKVDATEILPPFGRLNDTKGDFRWK